MHMTVENKTLAPATNLLTVGFWATVLFVGELVRERRDSFP